MLAFIAPVRHPQNSKSYRRVGELLDATLRSVCRQTHDDYHVIVVHNSMPAVEYSGGNVSYIQVGFPAPSVESTPRIDYGAHVVDKGTKCALGVVAAQRMGASHVMFIDADDYLHHDLASLANGDPRHPGWFSPQGYVHTAGTRKVQFLPDGFHRKNGSTSIVRTDLTRVPAALSLQASVAEVLETVQPDSFRVIAEHGKWEGRLAELGLVMDPMPFPSAVWEIGTGENQTGNLVSGRRGIPIDQELAESYGLVPPSRLRSVRSQLSVTGRRVLRQFARKRLS